MTTQIPRTFQVMGITYTVVMQPSLAHDTNNLGMTNYRTQEIELQCGSEGYPIPEEQVEQCFFHELVHVVLHAMQEDELEKNEKFVDLFASLLHQIVSTMRT